MKGVIKSLLIGGYLIIIFYLLINFLVFIIKVAWASKELYEILGNGFLAFILFSSADNLAHKMVEPLKWFNKK